MSWSGLGGTSVTALNVANALAIYFAERSSGQFKDKYITFSEHPQLVDFSHCTSLRDKIRLALSHNECANTNVEAVFDLILQTAINANMKQKDMPANILILSDLEFDAFAVSSRRVMQSTATNSPAWYSGIFAAAQELSPLKKTNSALLW